MTQNERSLGQSIGLRLALEAVTRETERQEHRAVIAAKKAGAMGHAKARHEYTAKVLAELAEDIAVRIRQGGDS